MNTAFILMARHDALPVIPLAVVAKDYFDMTEKTFVSKLDKREIDLPVVRMERASQKTAKGVHLTDLAAYIDARREVAKKEHEAFVRARH